MKLIKEYTLLPDELKCRMDEGNVFFSREYGNYTHSCGSQMWYICDEDLLLPVSILTKVGIRQGQYVSEPMMLRGMVSKRRQADFLKDAAAMMKSAGVAWVSTSAAALFDVYPDDSERIPFGSHVIDLSLPEEMLLMNMHSKHRNSVRRAERNGVTVVSGGAELISDYLKADADTWARSNKQSYGDGFFRCIVSALENKSRIYVAYKDGIPQAGACYFWNQRMCYYMYGASVTNPEPGAANLLQWNAILEMKNEGVERFSFVGCRINEDEESKYHGIQRFKERFGGELCQGYMFRTVLHPVQAKLFHRLYSMKHHGTRVGSAIDQEIHKWPELQTTPVSDDR